MKERLLLVSLISVLAIETLLKRHWRRAVPKLPQLKRLAVKVVA